MSASTRDGRDGREDLGRARAVLGVSVTSLLVVGLVMTFSASFVESSDAFGGPYAIFLRHTAAVAVGVVALLVGRRLDRRWWRRIALAGFAAALALSALVLIPGVGTSVSGARRWLHVGPVSMQPAELLKLTLPLALADVVARRWAHLHAGDLRSMLVPAAPMIVVAAGLVFVSPDLESALLMGVIGLAVLWSAGLPARLLGAGTVGLVAVGATGIALKGFRSERLVAWLDPFADPANYGYQTVQGYLALGSGGLLGSGLGAARSKWLYLPNPHTDFIFAIVGEELGLLGTTTVLALYGGIAWAGVRIARAAQEPFDRMAATGIVTWMLAQAGLNMGSVVGLLPVTGVTLPLVSFGGTSLVVTMLGIGVLLSLAAGVDEAPVEPLIRRSARRPGGQQPPRSQGGRS